MNVLANITRPERDPKIIRSGPSVMPAADRLARNLGWFSIALGTAQLIMPRRFTATLGTRGRENMVRAFGVREIAAGVMSLSVDKQAGLWARVAGDALDLVALRRALHPRNRKRGNVAIALGLVGGIAALDLIAAGTAQKTHSRGKAKPRDYSDRSGFPGGIAAARSAIGSPQFTR